MLFEGVDEGVIARQVQVAQARSVFIVRDHCKLVPIEAYERLGEVIAAIHVFFAFATGAFSRARMDANDGRPFFVPEVVLTVFDEGEEELAEGLQIRLFC